MQTFRTDVEVQSCVSEVHVMPVRVHHIGKAHAESPMSNHQLEQMRQQHLHENRDRMVAAYKETLIPNSMFQSCFFLRRS